MSDINTISSAIPACIKLLTEKEVAALIRKSVHWLRRKRWEGGPESISYRKLGASVRYAESDVLNWIERHSLQTSSSEAEVNHDR